MLSGVSSLPLFANAVPLSCRMVSTTFGSRAGLAALLMAVELMTRWSLPFAFATDGDAR